MVGDFLFGENTEFGVLLGDNTDFKLTGLEIYGKHGRERRDGELGLGSTDISSWKYLDSVFLVQRGFFLELLLQIIDAFLLFGTRTGGLVADIITGWVDFEKSRANLLVDANQHHG